MRSLIITCLLSLLCSANSILAIAQPGKYLRLDSESVDNKQQTPSTEPKQAIATVEPPTQQNGQSVNGAQKIESGESPSGLLTKFAFYGQEKSGNFTPLTSVELFTYELEMGKGVFLPLYIINTIPIEEEKTKEAGTAQTSNYEGSPVTVRIEPILFDFGYNKSTIENKYKNVFFITSAFDYRGVTTKNNSTYGNSVYINFGFNLQGPGVFRDNIQEISGKWSFSFLPYALLNFGETLTEKNEKDQSYITGFQALFMFEVIEKSALDLTASINVPLTWDNVKKPELFFTFGTGKKIFE